MTLIVLNTILLMLKVSNKKQKEQQEKFMCIMKFNCKTTCNCILMSKNVNVLCEMWWLQVHFFQNIRDFFYHLMKSTLIWIKLLFLHQNLTLDRDNFRMRQFKSVSKNHRTRILKNYFLYRKCSWNSFSSWCAIFVHFKC